MQTPVSAAVWGAGVLVGWAPEPCQGSPVNRGIDIDLFLMEVSYTESYHSHTLWRTKCT